MRLVELLPVGSDDETAVISGANAINLVLGVERHARSVEEHESEIAGHLLKPFDFFRRERRALHQERQYVVVTDDCELRFTVPSAAFTNLLRERHEPQSIEHPSRDRQHAIVCEMREVVIE